MDNMPFNPALRLGFIGGALNSAVGRAHFNASRLDGNFRVDCGCFSRHRENNLATAVAYSVSPERVSASWEELLDKEKGAIDAVLILTPTQIIAISRSPRSTQEFRSSARKRWRCRAATVALLEPPLSASTDS